MIDNEEETTKSILTGISQNLSDVSENLGLISGSLEELVELLRECTFSFNQGRARAIRNSPVD